MSKMASKLPNSAMSLKRFMVRSQVLKLYRDFMRTTRKVSDLDYRVELQRWVRDDFKKNKHHTEEEVIKMMMNHGQRSLKELKRSLNLSS